MSTIAWQRTEGPPPREQLRSDRRVTRRRLSDDRRSGQERRTMELADARSEERRVAAQRRSGWDRRFMGERRRRVTTW